MNTRNTDNKLVRGGSWDDPSWDARAAAHGRYRPLRHYSHMGLRLVIDAPPPFLVKGVRGGSWNIPQAGARAAYRDRAPPAGRGGYLGLRLIIEGEKHA